MESKYEARIIAKFSAVDSIPLIYLLDIPDEYDFMDKELTELIISSTESAISAYRTEQGAAANPYPLRGQG